LHLLVSKAPDLLFTLIDRLAQVPFLLAELFGRLPLSREILEPILSTIGASVIGRGPQRIEIMGVAKNAVLTLRILGAEFD
jgi:hypothetical protein